MVDIKQHKGLSRSGKEIDTGIDAIWLTEAGRKRCIGYMGREKGAPAQLIEPDIPEVIIKEIKRKAVDRDLANVPEDHRAAVENNPREVQREVQVVPEVDEAGDE